jgi:quercetin dioxygenase-like cupin family protein
MTYAFATLDELGSGAGFRKVRAALGVEAFGVNALVLPAGEDGVWHYHDTQDELYFVHRGTARIEVEGPGGPVRELPAGGLFHCPSTTPRKVSNAGSDELVVLAVGARGGYVGRDGHLLDPADLERRQQLSSSARGEQQA